MLKRKDITKKSKLSGCRLYRDVIKRIFDILFSILAIIILGIPMLIIAILIKKNYPDEPVIFKQVRI